MVAGNATKNGRIQKDTSSQSFVWLGLRPQETWAEQIPRPYSHPTTRKKQKRACWGPRHSRADEHPATQNKKTRVSGTPLQDALALRALRNDTAQSKSDCYSERNACTASTLAARAAGRADAITAAARITAAEAIKGNAPGDCSAPMYLPIARCKIEPARKPPTTPMLAITSPSERTLVRMLRGCAPRARRIPNSRVRPLTEKASTPATPTTEISRARVANPPNTMALSRSGVITSARTSCNVLARSTG